MPACRRLQHNNNPVFVENLVNKKIDIQSDITLNLSSPPAKKNKFSIYLAPFLGHLNILNINIDCGRSKLGNITSKRIKANVFKNNCTCACKILSFYPLYVNRNTNNVFLLLNGAQYAVPKNGGTQYARLR